MIINDNGGFKLRIKITKFLMGGCIIINTNNSIMCEKDYKLFAQNLKKILFGGTLFNIIFLFISVISIIFSFQIDKAFLVIMLSVVILVFCILPSGDIYKIMKLNKNPNDIAIYLLEDLKISYQRNEFCKEVVRNYVNKMLAKKQYNYKLLSIITICIEHEIIDNKNKLVEFARFINWFTNNYEVMKEKNRMSIRIISNNLMHEMIKYNLVSDEIIQEKNISVNAIKKHHMHDIYIEFEKYKKNFNINKLFKEYKI